LRVIHSHPTPVGRCLYGGNRAVATDPPVAHRKSFSLFPAITGDLFGKTWATMNYGIVYTAKGTASLFAGFGAAWLFEKAGAWSRVFWIMIACDVTAALLALLWLKPVAARTIARANAMAKTAA
jgi:hypothetical protein